MQAFKLPLPLLAACAACEGGVKRTHLLDAATEGALLLELYSRDGIGAMISTDFYEVPHVLREAAGPGIGGGGVGRH